MLEHAEDFGEQNQRLGMWQKVSFAKTASNDSSGKGSFLAASPR